MSRSGVGDVRGVPKLPIETVTASLPGTVHSGEFTALIDTGANITLVSKTLVEALNAVIHDACPPILAPDGRPICVEGLVEFQLAVPPLPDQRIYAAVASHPLKNLDLIVAMDYLEHFNFAIRRGVFEAIC